MFLAREAGQGGGSHGRDRAFVDEPVLGAVRLSDREDEVVVEPAAAIARRRRAQALGDRDGTVAGGVVLNRDLPVCRMPGGNRRGAEDGLTVSGGRGGQDPAGVGARLGPRGGAAVSE